jgi:restriction system protein
MPSDWRDYQQEAAAFFRTLGLNSEVDVRLNGVRTTHDVDVVVKSVHAGFEITWFVECKYWKTPISKLHVLGLRQIVIDLGADRGILLSESGFQAGAIEAATLTNVQLTSLDKLRESTKHDIYAMRIRDLFDRIETCNKQYWNISKEDRIDMGLRPDVGQFGYSGKDMIDYSHEVLSQALRNRYPIVVDSLAALAFKLKENFSSPNEVVSTVEPFIEELERKLNISGAPS